MEASSDRTAATGSIPEQSIRHDDEVHLQPQRGGRSRSHPDSRRTAPSAGPVAENRVNDVASRPEQPDPRSIDTKAYELHGWTGVTCRRSAVSHSKIWSALRREQILGTEDRSPAPSFITSLIEHTQPTFHFSGHVHHLNGPRSYGRTWSWSLDCLISSVRWRREENGFRMGCLAVLDTSTRFLQPITDLWLREFDTRGFDFDSWYESFAEM